MHVLYLTSGLTFGGAQNITVGLAEEAVRQGHRASILTVCQGNDYAARLQQRNVEFTTLGYTGRFTPRNAFRLLRERQRLIRAVGQINPDIVHEQLFIPKVLLYGMSSVVGCPVIQTQQDNSPWWHQRDVYARLQTHIERVMARRTAHYTAAISQSVRDDVLALFRIPSERCPLIYNFMEMPPQHLVCSRRKPDSFKIFMVTRLTLHKKGLDTAIAVFEAVRAELPRAEFIIVGDGPDKGQLRAMVAAKGLTDAVEFRGYQSDVYQQYAEADVVLMPSRWEGFGITAAEAAAAGVPVVASRVGGLKEVVVHGQTGFTCAPEAVAGFARHVIELLTNDVLYERIAETAITSATERFSRKKAFLQYESLYRKTLAQAQP